MAKVVKLNRKISATIYIGQSSIYLVIVLKNLSKDEISIIKIFFTLSQIAVAIGFRVLVYSYLNKAYRRLELQSQLVLIGIVNYILVAAIFGMYNPYWVSNFL